MPHFARPDYQQAFNEIASPEVVFTKAKPDARRLSKIVFDLAATCNMGCTYCFADQGRYGEHVSEKPRLLSVEMARSIMESVFQRCSDIGHIKFFGGEPLLAVDAIAEVCRLTESASQDGRIRRKPTFNIVTNGTVYSKKISSILSDNKIRMTISVDGPKEIHDAQRQLLSGKGTFDQIKNNIRKFQEDGCRLGVLESVYTPKHLSLGFSMVDIYEFLDSEFGDFFDLIVIHPFDQPSLDLVQDSAAKRQYILEMQEQTRALYKELSIRSNSRIASMLKSISSPTRDENLCGVGYDIITVKPDSSVYSCYVFSEQKDHSYGSILSPEFWQRYSSGELSAVMDDASRFKHTACQACDIQKACTHCLSGMSSASGMDAILPDVNCFFNIGQIEGLLEAISEVKSVGRLDKLLQELRAG